MEIFSKNQTNGARIIERISIGRATKRETLSAFCDAKVFGVISPKTRIKNVMTPVAIPIPLDPNSSVNMIVASEAAPIFTRLFPIRIVMINLCGFCLRRYKTAAPFFPCLTRDFTLIWLRDIRAVSTPEKNADSINRTTRIVIWVPNISLFHLIR